MNAFKSVCCNFGDDFVNCVAQRDWSKFFKGDKLILLWDESDKGVVNILKDENLASGSLHDPKEIIV